MVESTHSRRREALYLGAIRRVPWWVLLLGCRPESREAEERLAHLRVRLERSVIAVDVGRVDPSLERELVDLGESPGLSPTERDAATFALVRLHDARGRRDAALSALKARDAKKDRALDGDPTAKRLRAHLLADEPLEEQPAMAPVILDEVIRMPLGSPGVTATLEATNWRMVISPDAEPNPAWKATAPVYGDRPLLVEDRRSHQHMSLAIEGGRAVVSTGDLGLIEYPGHLGPGTTSTLVFDGGSLGTYVRIASPPPVPELRFVVGLAEGYSLRRIGAFVEMVDAAAVPRFRFVASELLDSTGNGVPVEPSVERCVQSSSRSLREPRIPQPGERVRCTVSLRWRRDVRYPAMFSATLQSTERLTGGDVSHESFVAPLAEGRALAVARGNVAQVFDATSKTWAIVEPPPFVFRHRDRLVALGDDRALAVSAQDRRLAIFSARTGRWSPPRSLTLDGSLGPGRGLALLPKRNGKVLVFTDAQPTFELDPATGTETPLAPSPLIGATNLQALELADGSILVGGGFAPRVARYFPGSNRWSCDDLEVSTNGADLVRLSNGNVLVVDVGRGARQWDLAASTVHPVRSPLLPSSYHSMGQAHVSHGRFHYVAGGNFLYDEMTDDIRSLGVFPSGAKVHNAVVVLSDGRALAIGGGQETRSDLLRLDAKTFGR